MKMVTDINVGVIGINMSQVDCVTATDNGGAMLHFASGRVLIVAEPLTFFTKSEKK